MKNKGFIALIAILTALIGGVVFGVSIQTVEAADYYISDYYGPSYGGDYYDDYGYGGGYYDDYGYDDYGYDDCYDCYDYDECDYGYCGDYEYDDCYFDCYDDCYYGYGCDEDKEEPVEIHNNNSNTNNNSNYNENINNIRINISNPVSRSYDYDYDEPVRVRENDSLICTPSSQSAGINQSVSLRVSGGTGSYTWNAPGSQNLSGRGDSVSLRYPTSGLKSVVVSSGGQTATCFVQVTGGQVLAEFIELPNTGAGGINAIMPNLLAIGGAAIAGLAALVFFVRRAIIA